MNGRILMVGCGTMGGAMLARWLDAGIDPARFTVVSPSRRAAPPGVTVIEGLPTPDQDDEFATVVLAMKPQQLAVVAAGPLRRLAPRLLVSILAGVQAATLAGICDAAAVVRAMPNLPVAIGRGVVALYGADTDQTARDEAAVLMDPLGHVEWIADEDLFDAVTALAGSGPAFLFRFIDALGAAGAAMGLAPDQAARLALAMVAGAATMAADGDVSAAMLADRVASPGGSTRKGLDILDNDRALERLLTATLQAATRRNRELAAAAR